LFFKGVGRSAAVALTVAAVACARTPVGKPPVVLISVDTLRADHLPPYGYSDVATPAIDTLAHDSIRFDNAYSHVPLTLPSHAALLTGLLPYENGVRDNLGFRLAETHATLATLLRAEGYATGAAVSSYVLRSDRGLGSGFDHYDDRMPDNPTRERPGGQSADALARWAAGIKEKPLFLFLHIYEPHAPYTPPEPFRSRYAGRPYDGEIATADAAVGRFLDFLKRERLYDPAIILLLSDHGEGLGEHGEEEHGVFLYREDLRVPLFLKLPGAAEAGRTVSAPVGLTDVVPTVLSLLHRAVPENLRGVPLLAFLKSGDVSPRRIYGETLYPRLNLAWSDLASLTDDRYEYIEAPRPELYDLRADPQEQNNLAPGAPAAFRTMRVALAALNRPFALPEASTPEEVKRLASLGYIHVSSAPAPGRLPDPKDRIEILRDFRRLLDLFSSGNDKESIALARKVVARDPGILSAWTALSGSLERTGKPGEAVAALREGIAHASPETVPELLAEAYDDLALLLKRSGDKQGQETALRDAVARGVASQEMRRDLARVYVESGRGQDAIALLRAGPVEDGQSLEILGVALASVGKNDEAKETLLRAWAAAPGNARIAFNLGTLALRNGRASEARDWFTRSLQAKPDDPMALADLGLAQAALGESDAAAQSWSRALELDPRQYGALYNLALFELKNGRTEEGWGGLERFLATAPPDHFSGEMSEARRLLQARGKS
jgi:choline-sulfatase